MKNNLGTLLGGLALVISLGNSYFLYDLSQSKTNEIQNENNSIASTDASMQNNSMPMEQQAPQKEITPPAPTEPPTTISFKKTEHDFGKVKQDSENKYEFTFTNTGKNPLVITDAKGSCGCTVPDYPHEPVPPGGSSKIKVVYSPGKQEGKQNKTVTITANTEPQQTVLAITAEVLK